MEVDDSAPPTPKAFVARLRADARLNDERVFAAALEIFEEFGLQGTVPQVAERANVGKATVYRNYLTKEHLVEAVVRHRSAELEQKTAQAVKEASPDRAFAAFVLSLFDHLAHDRLLAESLAARPAGSLFDRVAALMEAAKTTGAVRADATPLDLRVILCGMAVQLTRMTERNPALWRRYAEMTLQALEPPPSPPDLP
ncbi:TetR/AcrR family transcriptional regulator [Micromonospora sp. NPDC050276]|uniref:TetR/AcrR family transcriptional regulator n=1 Tax=Micromonospora sp. NPDC050276 TaxID=3364278 RepID=UPI0037AF5ED4